MVWAASLFQLEAGPPPNANRRVGGSKNCTACPRGEGNTSGGNAKGEVPGGTSPFAHFVGRAASLRCRAARLSSDAGCKRDRVFQKSAIRRQIRRGVDQLESAIRNSNLGRQRTITQIQRRRGPFQQ